MLRATASTATPRPRSSAAPFRNVISHGLTVDEQGRKMAKSLGNSEDAADADNRMGADVLRLVYASLDYTAEIALGDTIYSAVAESYRKIRNTCRYMLGNLSDFDPARDATALSEMLEFDRFILSRVEKLKEQVRRDYEAFAFQSAYHAILNFIVVDLSSLYIDVARDRLYCSAATSRERRSAQTALFNILDNLLRMLAPLVPFTTDEVYAHMPGKRLASVHLLTLHPANPAWRDDKLEARWERLMRVRDEALKLLEAMRKAGTIGAPLEAAIGLGAEDGLAEALAGSRDLLKELFIVSEVAILSGAEVAAIRREAAGREDYAVNGNFARVAADPAVAILGKRAPGVKCARCWCYFDDGGDPELCPRCRAVVRAQQP